MKVPNTLEVFIKIFVTVGTQPHNFDRLLSQVIKLKDEYDITIQYGSSELDIDNGFAYADSLDEYINDADLVITHAGVGSIMKCLKANKRFIAAARLSEYNEHVNDHQLELKDFVLENNYGLFLTSFDDLARDIKLALNNDFSPFVSNQEYFNEELNKLILEVLNG